MVPQPRMRTPCLHPFSSGRAIAKGAEVWYRILLVQLRHPHAGAHPVQRYPKQLTGLGSADRGIKTRDNPYYDYPDGSTATTTPSSASRAKRR